MGHQLATVTLGPLLYWQGRRVRKNTPILPEPEGVRHGQVGDDPEFGLLILGDSAAAGVGCDDQSQALSGQTVNAITEHSFYWRLWAKTGLTTADVIRYLAKLPQADYEQVLISVGVNDVTSGRSLSGWLRDIERLTECLADSYSAKHILFSALPPMHAFPALPQPLRWYLGRQAKRMNRTLKEWADQRAECVYLSAPFDMTPDMAAADGFHPSAKSYAVWGVTAAAKISQWSKANSQ